MGEDVFGVAEEKDRRPMRALAVPIRDEASILCVERIDGVDGWMSRSVDGSKNGNCKRKQQLKERRYLMVKISFSMANTKFTEKATLK